jgi:plasmid stability protein
MANLTLQLDDELLRRARVRAAEQGTSVNAVVRTYLERFARDEEERSALRQVLSLAQTSTASSGAQGRTWRREDAHER